MSTDVVNSPIVVGIDGSESALIAMRWAAQEADAHGWSLRLVNAYEQLPATPTMVAKTTLEVAEESLREARKILESRSYAGLDVSTVVWTAHHAAEPLSSTRSLRRPGGRRGWWRYSRCGVRSSW
jgi:nucleotide-binding universal stress UspA family protein